MLKEKSKNITIRSRLKKKRREKGEYFSHFKNFEFLAEL
jgi:hypothetical protein